MRRIDLRPQKKLRNPARHCRSLEAWALSFDSFFPTPEMTDRGLWYEKIGFSEKVVSPPHITPDVQAFCTRTMIDTARRIWNARPGDLKDARVYTYLTYPNMFGSFLEVAFERNAHLFFSLPGNAGRIGDDTSWCEYTPLDSGAFPGRNLEIPDGFQIAGCSVREYDADMTPPERHTEAWVVGELK